MKSIQSLRWQKSILTAVIVLGLFYAYQILDGYWNIRQIKALLPRAEAAILALDWPETKALLAGLAANISELEGDLNRLFPLNRLPGVNNEYRAAKKILAAGQISLRSGDRAVEWISQLPLQPKTDKKKILAALTNSGPLWRSLKEDGDLVLSLLTQARQESRLPWLARQTNSIAGKLAAAQEVLAQLEPYLPLLSKAAGFPYAQTYLLLLQNNTELRPTGGFIGTFGALTVLNGDIIGFQTDNVYNLDEPAKAYNNKIPPDPIRRYVKQSQWFFRDSNWDPDFPTSARTAIRFYKDERGPVQNFNGVIAFTPKIIEDLLKVIGPIAADKRTFTAENLVELLQYNVEVGFKKNGINVYNRKKIIDDVAKVLKDKILALSPQQLRALWPILQTAFAEKQLMVYFTDPKIAELAQNFNLDNRIRESDGDYLYVVDANLGSLKTDPAVARQINYRLRPSGSDSLESKVDITYIHSGDFDWKTTRYRTYARVYVPQGSTLLAATGNESAVTVEDAHNKTVFGAFISIEPGATETLSFTYKLPASLVQTVKKGQYNLLVQKQAGTEGHELNLDIDNGNARLKKTENLTTDLQIIISR